MIVTFGKEYLQELYIRGKASDKSRRFQPEVIKRYRKCIDILRFVPRRESLYNYNSLHFETLIGDKAGLYSIRVNLQYRIEFSLEDKDGDSSVTICNIEELSNHYK